MINYHILLNDFNTGKPYKYDIMSYLVDTYTKCKKENHWWPVGKIPESYEEFKLFVKRVCMHQFWSRCQYEFLMLRWPPGSTETLEQCQKILDSAEKIDGYKQIEMNLDVVTTIFLKNLGVQNL